MSGEYSRSRKGQAAATVPSGVERDSRSESPAPGLGIVPPQRGLTDRGLPRARRRPCVVGPEGNAHHRQGDVAAVADEHNEACIRPRRGELVDVPDVGRGLVAPACRPFEVGIGDERRADGKAERVRAVHPLLQRGRLAGQAPKPHAWVVPGVAEHVLGRCLGSMSKWNMDSGGMATSPRSRISRSIVVPERSSPRRKKGNRSPSCSRLRGVRISLADPVSYTLPYDRSLAGALARRGHDVDLFAASFVFAELPPPGRLPPARRVLHAQRPSAARQPRSRLRFLSKGLEYVPSARRLRRRSRASTPTCCTSSGSGCRATTCAGWRRPAGAAGRLHRPRRLPRRTADKVDLWRRVFDTVDRVVVHGAGRSSSWPSRRRPRQDRAHSASGVRAGAGDRAAAGPDTRVLRAHPPVEGARLLVRGATGDRRGVPDVRLIVAGDPSSLRSRSRSSLASWVSPSGSSGACAFSAMTRSPTSWRRRPSSCSLPPHRVVGRAGDGAGLRAASGRHRRRLAR